MADLNNEVLWTFPPRTMTDGEHQLLRDWVGAADDFLAFLSQRQEDDREIYGRIVVLLRATNERLYLIYCSRGSRWWVILSAVKREHAGCFATLRDALDFIRPATRRLHLNLVGHPNHVICSDAGSPGLMQPDKSGMMIGNRDSATYPPWRAHGASLRNVMLLKRNQANSRNPHHRRIADSVAKQITLRHPSGLSKVAYVGFSWTSLFFGGLPASFRGDWLAFCLYQFLVVAGSLETGGIGAAVLWVAWPFFYNRWHGSRLIEKGYRITGAQMPPGQASVRALK
jgi:hypothetical protein